MSDRVRCHEFAERALLYAAGELEAEDRAAVEAHARECSACAGALAAETRLWQACAERTAPADEMDGSGLLLARCRSQLAESLDDIGVRDVFPLWRRLLAPAGWAGGFRRALASYPGWSAAALVVAGAVAGLGALQLYRTAALRLPDRPVLTVSASPRLSERDLETMGVQAVRWEPAPEGASPRVELQLQLRRPVVVQGSAEDTEIRRVLTYVVEHPQQFDPGVRLDSLEVLRAHTADRAVRAALCEVARRDENPGVRLKAMEALQGQVMSDPEVWQAMLEALADDENSGVRIEAANALLAAVGAGASPVPLGPQALGVLRDRMENDSNSYVRLISAAVLAQVSPSEPMPLPAVMPAVRSPRP